jgi:hypothetical protein
MLLVLCFQNSFFNFSKKKYFIVICQGNPLEFSQILKMNPDERTLSPFIDLLICHNRITEGVEYLVLPNQIDDWAASLT